MDWTLLFWLAVTLVILLFVERWVHRHLQGVMLLITGDHKLAAVLYALPLLPGIALHELSHAVAATLLMVKVGRISIRPKRTGRRIQLGFVPVEKTDVVRASLIGLAPLLTGCGVILLIGYRIFGVDAVSAAFAAGNWPTLLAEVRRALAAPDAWVWAYVIFTVSNTMMPSQADRQTWATVMLFLILAGIAIWSAGWGPVVVACLSRPVAVALRWLITVCALTVAVDLPFALLIALTEKLLERVKGWQVDYQG